jgi:hypothetical protein
MCGRDLIAIGAARSDGQAQQDQRGDAADKIAKSKGDQWGHCVYSVASHAGRHGQHGDGKLKQL